MPLTHVMFFKFILPPSTERHVFHSYMVCTFFTWHVYVCAYIRETKPDTAAQIYHPSTLGAEARRLQVPLQPNQFSNLVRPTLEVRI